MAPVEYTEFVEKLQAHKDSITYNWDVAVIYGTKEINNLLAKEYRKRGSVMPTKVEFSFSSVDWLRREVTFSYEFNVGPPCIQFDSTSTEPSCSLEMAITSGKFWGESSGTKGPEEVIKGGIYSLKLSKVPLGTVTASADGQVKSVKNRISFPDNEHTGEQIVVDFATSGSDVVSEIIYHGDQKTRSEQMQAPQLSIALKDFFYKSSAIAYTLAIINNTKPDSGVLDLVPKSFRVVCYGDETASYLTLLIETRGSNTQGITTAVQSSWHAQWERTLGMDPVPKDMSAAIIINKSFFIEKYLGKVLSQNASSVTSTAAIALPEGESGFKVEFELAEIKRAKGTVSEDLLVGVNRSAGTVSVEERMINPNQGGEKLNMVFNQSNGADQNPTIDIKWSYKDNIEWKEQSYVAGDHPTAITNRGGTVIATFTLKPKKVTLTGTLTQEAFSVSCGITQDDWSWTLEAEGVEWTEHLKKLGAPFGVYWKSTHIPQFARQMALPVTFKLDFGELRFFSVTNVLLPGRKVIDIDLEAGMRIPNDIVIVGSVVKDT